MTDRTERPTEELGRVDEAFAMLLEAAKTMTEEQARGPSRLPGWTRRHVLTHIARSGEGDARNVEGALRDEVTDKYPGGNEQRAHDIEAGAGRTIGELVMDVVETQSRLTTAWAAMPDDAWGRQGRYPMGIRSIAEGVRGRRREILVHLIDLDIGVHPRDLPAEYRAADAEFLREMRKADTWPDAEWNEAGPAEPHQGTPADVVRAFGMMSGGPVVLALLANASVRRTLRSLVRLRRPPKLALLGAAATAAYFGVVRPWSRRWGATDAELAKPLPGDELVEDPGISMTRAVTINAPVESVWPWLAQIGQDRGGFYSYASLENLAGCDMHNAERVHPEWQHREVGETVLLHPATGLKLARFEPNRVLAFEGGWYFVVEPIDKDRTRLYARSRVTKGLPSVAYALFIELPHFVMERKMLRGIKQRAETSRRG